MELSLSSPHSPPSDQPATGRNGLRSGAGQVVRGLALQAKLQALDCSLAGLDRSSFTKDHVKESTLRDEDYTL